MDQPQEIAIVVHGARNLQGKKKGRHKYSVVFGVGTNRYRTAVDQDSGGNPQWTEESLIEVDNPQHPLVFVVREKDDVLGQVTLPLSCLPPPEKRCKRKFPLQPHRKAPNPQGELIFEAWVSRYAATSPEAPEIRVTCETPLLSPSRSNPFQVLKFTIQRSPIMARRNATENSPKTTTSNKPTSNKTTAVPHLLRRNSRSLHDLTDLKQAMTSSAAITTATASAASKKTSNSNNSNSLMVGGLSGAHTARLSSSSCELNANCESQRPTIQSVTPSTGPVDGGTSLTITGCHLGSCREDVVGLFVCSANCLGSLEYCSPEKLQCTTKPWRSGKGYISVETQSGGKGTSLVQFTFKQAEQSTVQVVAPVDPTSGTTPEHSKKSRLLARLSGTDCTCQETKKALQKQTSQELAETKQANMELRADIKILTEENTKLREQNETLKIYVDHLVARVMEECPEALCAGAASAAIVLATR